MITIRKANDRGHSKLDWLSSYHTFSFGDYYDPEHIGFGTLRVINEDTVKPGKGFGQHPHQNMEIISYVIQGALEHKDSLGTGSIIRPGEIQRMSAGTGIEHSEFNHSSTEPVDFLQIWIMPEKTRLEPSYEQKTIPQTKNEFILIGSKDPSNNAITIHQDVKLFVAYLTTDHTIDFKLEWGRRAWLQLIKGSITLNGNALSRGDGAAITDEPQLTICCLQDAELLFFELKY